MEEATFLLAHGHVGEDVEFLARRPERAFEEVVVVRGHEELKRQPALVSKKARDARKQVVQRRRGEIGIEDLAQRAIERTLAGRERDPLRDTDEVHLVGDRRFVHACEMPRELGAARQQEPLIDVVQRTRLPIREVCARPQERYDRSLLELGDDCREMDVELVGHAGAGPTDGGR